MEQAEQVRNRKEVWANEVYDTKLGALIPWGSFNRAEHWTTRTSRWHEKRAYLPTL